MIKNKKKIVEFIVIFIVGLIMCNGFIRMHYTTDTYKIVDEGYKNYAINWSLKDGRIIMAVLLWICSEINLQIEITNFVFTVAGIGISCVSVILMKNIILKFIDESSIKKGTLVLMLSFFAIFNFMYVEAIYFLEIIIISLSILFFVLSIKCRVQKNNHYVIKSIIYSVLRNNFISRYNYIFYSNFLICISIRI